MDKSLQQRCLRNCRSVADMELYSKISEYGNKKLGHIWRYKPNQVHKIMRAVISYCINNGTKLPDYKHTLGRRMQFEDGDSGVTITTWAP